MKPTLKGGFITYFVHTARFVRDVMAHSNSPVDTAHLGTLLGTCSTTARVVLADKGLGLSQRLHPVPRYLGSFANQVPPEPRAEVIRHARRNRHGGRMIYVLSFCSVST